MLLITAIKISCNHDMANVKFAMMNKTTSSLKKIVSTVKTIGNVNIDNLSFFSHGKKTAAANDTVFTSSHESDPGVNTAKEKGNANEPTGERYPEKLNPFFDETLTHTEMSHDSAKRQESYPEIHNPFFEPTPPHTETGHDSATRHKSHPEQKIAAQADCGITPISLTRDQHLIDPDNPALAGTPFLAANQNQPAKVTHSAEAANTRHSIVPSASLSDTPLHTIGNLKSKDAKGGMKGVCKSLASKLKKGGVRNITPPQIQFDENDKKLSDRVYIPNVAYSTAQGENTNRLPTEKNYKDEKEDYRNKLYDIYQGSDPGNETINLIDKSLVTRYFLGQGLEKVKGIIKTTPLKAFSFKEALPNRFSKLTLNNVCAVMEKFDKHLLKELNKVYDNLESNICKSEKSEGETFEVIYAKFERSLSYVKDIEKKNGKAAVVRLKNIINDPAVVSAIKSKIKSKVHEAFSGEIIINASEHDSCLVNCLIKSLRSFCIEETVNRLKKTESNAEALVIQQYFEKVLESYHQLEKHQKRVLAFISNDIDSSYPNSEIKNTQTINRDKYLTEIKNSIYKIISGTSQGLEQEINRIGMEPGRLAKSKQSSKEKESEYERINNTERAYKETWKSLKNIINKFPRDGDKSIELHNEINTKFKEMSTPEQVAKDIDKKMNSMKSRWRRFVNGLKTPASKGVATVSLLLAGLSVVNPIALPVSALIASVYLIVKWKEAHDDYKAMLIRRNESQNTALLNKSNF